MIYLDNAATTYPKPKTVQTAAAEALLRFGANPGRGGYRMAMDTAAMVYACRKKAADFFDAETPEQVVFSPSCTAAINVVLKGLLREGDHVVVSDLEHNAVMRPLEGLREKGVSWSAAHVTPYDNDATVNSFRQAMRPNTKLVFCTHASNVFGIRLPIERLAALAHVYGAYFAVDAAQSAGVLPLRMKSDNIDFICAAGHKGLYGTMGTGILITKHGELLRPYCEGGTGSLSVQLEQPGQMPDRFESGTLNVPGIAALAAGLDFVKQKTPEAIHKGELQLVKRLYKRLQVLPHLILYTREPTEFAAVPVLSFNVEGVPSEEVGVWLAKRGVAVRCGLHCAPQAHKAFGTLETGTVRVAPSAFSSVRDMDTFAAAAEEFIKQNKFRK